MWAAGEGAFAEAAVAYEAAGDVDSMVRLSLDQLKSPHKAAAMVRKAGSRDAAQRLARYCLTAQDFQVLPIINITARNNHQNTLKHKARCSDARNHWQKQTCLGQVNLRLLHSSL